MVTQARERLDSSDDPPGDLTNGADLNALVLTAEEWAQEQEWCAWLTGYLTAPDPDRYAGCWPAPARPEKLIGSAGRQQQWVELPLAESWIPYTG